MLISALGTGMFAFHHFFRAFGIGLSFIILALSGYLYYLVCDIFIYSWQKYPNSKTMNILVEKVLGQIYGMFFNIIFFIFGCLIQLAFFITINKTFYENFKTQIWNYFPNTQVKNFESFNKAFCFLTAVCLFLLHLKRSMDSFKYISLFSFALLLFLIVLVVAQTGHFYEKIKDVSTITWFNFDFTAYITTFGIGLFAYNNTSGFVELAKSVANPTVLRLQKIFRRTFIILFVMFFSFGLASYLSLGDNTKP